MITLMMKDVRQSKWPLLLAFVVLATPTLVWVISALTDDHGMKFRNGMYELAGAAFMGAVASLIATSGFAGVAFAKERRERTAEMVATMPVERWKVVLSKGVVAVVLSLAPVMVGAVVMIVLTVLAGRASSEFGETMKGPAVLTGASWLLLLGLGWGLSSMLRSDVLVAAMPVLVLVIVGLSILNWGRPPYGSMPNQAIEQLMFVRLSWVFGLIGVAGLATGMVVALRRKSP
ncbi:MAG: ABC transporter permease [Phycisphaerales bacterium]